MAISMDLRGVLFPSASGQNRTFTFAATGGRVLVSVPSVSWGATNAQLTVTAPDGSKPVNTAWVSTGSKWVLESTLVGTYTIFLDPLTTVAGTASVKVDSVTDLPTQALTLDAPAVSSTFTSGQNRTLTFASSGGSLKVSLPSSTVSSLKVTVTAPDGSKPVNQATGVTGSQWTLT